MTTETVQTYTALHERVAIVADAETGRFTTVQDGHPLSPCAAAFCDGDLSRYLELYNVVFHSQSEKPNGDTRVVLTRRGWLVGVFQNLRLRTT